MVTAFVVVTFVVFASAAEKFQRFTGQQIQARLPGMEISDDVHWRDKYDRGGTLRSLSMGKQRTGKWWVEQNELCTEFGKESRECFQVWLAGRKVEFRRDGLDEAVLEGLLQIQGGKN